MSHFKTPKGTELPLLDLRGKPYLQVAHRMVWFREVFPLGKIDTECVERTEQYAIYRATISVPDSSGNYVKLADGDKREDRGHFPDYNEKAQTSAIGRALAMCGFGTQFAPELEEGERLADAPVDRVRSQFVDDSKTSRGNDFPARNQPKSYGTKYASPKQVQLLNFTADKSGMTEDDVAVFLRQNLEITEMSKVPFDAVNETLGKIQRWKRN